MPNMPTNIRATATCNSVTISWNAVSGAIGYTVSLNILIQGLLYV
jgi:hypothetical protein